MALSDMKIVAVNGDTWATPASTINALWAALSAGANAIKLSIFFTSEGTPVCAPDNNLLKSCGIDKNIHEITLAELHGYDAGATYRSTVLDEHAQPTGEHGDDLPWIAKSEEDASNALHKHPLKSRKALYHPSLKQVLELFGRRTAIELTLSESIVFSEHNYVQNLLDLVRRFGLLNTIVFSSSQPVLEQIRALAPNVLCSLQTEAALTKNDIDLCVQKSYSSVSVNFDALMTLTKTELQQLAAYSQSHGLEWSGSSHNMPFAPTPDALSLITQFSLPLASWQTRGTLPCAEALAPRFNVFSEDFAGKSLNEDYWAAGYSHVNTETKIEVNDALIIDIQAGKVYSGGAAICLIPIHKDFDAQVDFHVSHPYQATTFELAAIGIDPGYHHISHEKLSSRTVNLTFDVHGAPPYASSERDQNDGFRCGWNNSFNFAKFGDSKSERSDKDWLASSANMYNKYGRDVGDGSKHNLSGRLRLTRRGPLLSSYFRDGHNCEWVCSGTMLVQNLPDDVYLRLAAKHWGKLKDEPAPQNTVRFTHFEIHQPAPV